MRDWGRLGYGDDDLADGGSDRLVDALYALGSVEQIGERVREHLDAGADHVCLRVVTNAPMTGADEPLPRAEWRELAPLASAASSSARQLEVAAARSSRAPPSPSAATTSASACGLVGRLLAGVASTLSSSTNEPSPSTSSRWMRTLR